MFKQLILASVLIIASTASSLAECVSVQVSGYTKANGTYVQGYTRSCPGSYFPSATPAHYESKPYVPVPRPVVSVSFPEPKPGIDWRKVREIQAANPKPNIVPEPIITYEQVINYDPTIKFIPAVGYAGVKPNPNAFQAQYQLLDALHR